MIKHKIKKSEVEYDPLTGYFYWVKAYRKPHLTGKRAERKTTNGYLYIKAGGKMNSASRLAYQLFYKVYPGQLEIDHIDRNRTNNKPENLRLVTREQQLRNRKFKPNKCGVTGVSIHKKSGLYRSRYKNKTTYHKTLESAAAGYATLVSERLND
jgi:hypothetical protein